MSIELTAIPRIRRGFRLQWEEVQQGYVLLYPEGMIQLNLSAASILQQVNAEQNIEQIIQALQLQFPEADAALTDDVLAFLEEAYAKFWIENC
ncbi:pyrroloquinoline quinone biosynthesis peptide chaperone PqqD [Thiopseudomonas alkaliphila]|uniref:pyrroloquinoline quinone biosynthesis peptide chaperone PqqD n=1 Tax=Thiopseudomonas alkaliphila TaxID=1697053 RepID=UPI002577C289|nr:pyrroloquinoline quinone biosynthesis peptide chaperone PqqD [Thiopseudomonas alkaliphila]MDM1707757.1 pyrroloquinoline quinone biosynthesis peptide chaperone PqqD [Thiopseudomonas alkaliphila]